MKHNIDCQGYSSLSFPIHGLFPFYNFYLKKSQIPGIDWFISRLSCLNAQKIPLLL